MKDITRVLGSSELVLFKRNVNILLRIDLHNQLSLEKLSISINKIKYKHPLSSSYITPNNPLSFSTSFDREIPINITYKSIDDLIDGELSHSFNYEQPLMRVCVVENTLFFNFSHAIADAHGAIIYIKDLFSFYEGELVKQTITDLPNPIENILCLDNKNDSDTDLIIDKKDHENKKFIHRIIKGIINKPLLFGETGSIILSSSLSSLAIKAFVDSFGKCDDINRYINIDVRTLSNNIQDSLCFYSIGVSELYTKLRLMDIKSLSEVIASNSKKYSIDNLPFLVRGIKHDFKYENTISFSLITENSINVLYDNTLINNMCFYGNCFYSSPLEKKIFLLITPFKDNFNMTVHYDSRCLAHNEVQHFVELFSTSLKNYFI